VDNVQRVLLDVVVTRVWVFQEVVVAKKLCVILGDWIAPWREIHNVMRSCGTFGNPVSYDAEAVASCRQQLESMELERRSGMCDYDPNNYTYRGGDYTLIYLMNKWRHLKSTDPRDMIYALRGLVQEREKAAFEFVVDYSLSVEKVYKNLAKWELLHRKDLHFSH
jgi:hypothetical protein